MSIKGMLLTSGLIGFAVTLAGMSMTFAGYWGVYLQNLNKSKWPVDSLVIVGSYISDIPLYLLCLIIPDKLAAVMSPTCSCVIFILVSTLIWAIVAFVPMFAWHQFKKRRLASEDLTSLPTNATKV